MRLTGRASLSCDLAVRGVGRQPLFRGTRDSHPRVFPQCWRVCWRVGVERRVAVRARVRREVRVWARQGHMPDGPVVMVVVGSSLV